MFRGLRLLLIIAPVMLLGAACQRQITNTAGTAPAAEVLPPTPLVEQVKSPKVNEPKSAPVASDPKPKIIDTPSKPQHAITILPVPFTSQAPFAIWDEAHNEACEEASMIMAAEYFKGNKKLQLDKDYAETAISELIAWETENNYAVDVTAAEVVKILADYFKLQAQVEPYNPRSIKQAMANKQIVLLPAAGRLLGNPYYRRPGPLYHMLVVRGFEGDEFITNDPGTRRGENYRYPESVLERAVHDWNGGEVEQGEQVMIVVSKKIE